jgi:hypothetical protein
MAAHCKRPLAEYSPRSIVCSKTANLLGFFASEIAAFDPCPYQFGVRVRTTGSNRLGIDRIECRVTKRSFDRSEA